MNRPYDVMAAGHLCLDIIPRFSNSRAAQIGDIMRPGKLVNVKEAALCTGGPVSNTGINMKSLGNHVCFCARVGGDVIGKITADMLSESGNAQGIHVVEDSASSYTIVIAPPGIDRIFLHNPATNDTFGPDDLEPALIAQCRHFHFGYPPLMERMFSDNGEGLRRVFEIAKEAGATTSCDMTLPDPNSPSGQVDWSAILERIVPLIDVFLPSIEETLYMLEPATFLAMKKEHNDAELIDFLTPQDYTRLANRLIDMGGKVIGLKSGHRGFYAKTAGSETFSAMGAAKPADHQNWANRELWQQAYAVDDFGSATGSGDSAIAGFLTAFLRGLTIEEALQYAVCCGYQNVCVLDAISGIRSWEQLMEMIEAPMPFIEAHIDDPGWRGAERPGQWDREAR
ncbi:MAG: carbohydrate kinase family protein [Nitrospiraceae bacterium]|nr:carbohydrate kinase family protein [Nitrospiraceae bacterium]